MTSRRRRTQGLIEDMVFILTRYAKQKETGTLTYAETSIKDSGWWEMGEF